MRQLIWLRARNELDRAVTFLSYFFFCFLDRVFGVGATGSVKKRKYMEERKQNYGIFVKQSVLQDTAWCFGGFAGNFGLLQSPPACFAGVILLY